MRFVLPRRDKRTIYLHEMAIYQVVVPLLLVRIGIPPFWFFAAQAFGHCLAALISNKFYWWYGRRANTSIGRTLMVVAGCGWLVAGYLLSPR